MKTLQPEPDGPTPAELAAAILGDLGFTAEDVAECMAEPGAGIAIGFPRPEGTPSGGAA